MSYHRYTTDGFGVCVNDLEGIDEQKTFELLKYAPKAEKNFFEFLEKEGIVPEELSMDILDDYEIQSACGIGTGICAILWDVIWETEDIDLYIAHDVGGVQYLLFCPVYPWSNVTQAERSMTKERMEEIFRKYIGVLTSEPFDVEYYSVEKGG